MCISGKVIKSIIIVSSGFKGIGKQGKNREEKIAGIAKKYLIRIMGPNCMGVIRPSSLLNITFIERLPKPGILDWAMSKNIGMSAFVSLGSILDVDFFGVDTETRSIIIYTESFADEPWHKYGKMLRKIELEFKLCQTSTKKIVKIKPNGC